jgi:drug/metabolite transporter (DMT)-like permease
MWFVFAAASAVCFGLRGIFYHWTSQRPIDRNLLLMGVYLSGTLIALAANFAVGQHWSSGALMGISMGLFSFISNASMYRGFAVGKASLVAMFTGLPPVVVVISAYMIWGEKLSLWQSLSFVIIVFGILLIRYSNELSWGNLKGAHWGALAMVGFGLTDLSSKQATLLEAQTLPTLAAMYVTGTILFGIAWLINKMKHTVEAARLSSREPASSAKVTWSTTKTLVLGLVIGLTNISGMMLLMPAFKLGVTGLVSAVIAMNVILVLLYARFGLKERFSPVEVCGLILAVIGILLLRLAG